MRKPPPPEKLYILDYDVDVEIWVAVIHEGQGGLLDVAPDPDFGDNGWG